MDINDKNLNEFMPVGDPAYIQKLQKLDRTLNKLITEMLDLQISGTTTITAGIDAVIARAFDTCVMVDLDGDGTDDGDGGGGVTPGTFPNLLKNGMFDPDYGLSWTGDVVHFVNAMQGEWVDSGEEGDYPPPTEYPTIFWAVPPDEGFAAGKRYVVRGYSPDFDPEDTYSGLQLNFYTVNESDVQTYGGSIGIRYFNRIMFSGVFKIPDSWNGTDRLKFQISSNAYRYEISLDTIREYELDTNEILTFGLFNFAQANNNQYWDELIFKLKPSESDEFFDVKTTTSFPSQFYPGATFTVTGKATGVGASECEFVFGWIDNDLGGAYVTAGSSSNIVINAANQDAWEGQITIDTAWNGLLYNGNILQLSFVFSGDKFPFEMHSIKAVADEDQLLLDGIFEETENNYFNGNIYNIRNAFNYSTEEYENFDSFEFVGTPNAAFVAGGTYTVKLTASLNGDSSPDSFAFEIGRIVSGTPVWTGASGFNIDSSSTNISGNVTIPATWDDGSETLICRLRAVGSITGSHYIYIYSIKEAV